MWDPRLLRDWTPTRHRDLLRFAALSVQFSPNGVPIFAIWASSHLLFSGLTTDSWHHHDPESGPGSIRLLLFRRRERDGACLRATISPAAPRKRDNCHDPTPLLCRHRTAPRE